MTKQLITIGSEAELIEDKYGLPVSCRVTADFKHQVTEEALVRGMKLGPYIASVLMKNHQNSAQTSAYVELAFRQLESLKKENEALKAELAKRQVAPRGVMELAHMHLGKNYSILKHVLDSGQPITKENLAAMGYDFTWLMRKAILNGKEISVIYDLCFYQEKEFIHVKTIQL